MTMLYHRPAHPVLLSVEPQLASLDRGGSPGQVRLGRFLDHAEAVAAPTLAALDGLLAVELTVGLSGQLSPVFMPSRWPTLAIEPRALPGSARSSKTIATARSRSSAGCAFRDARSPNFPRDHGLQGTRSGPITH